MKKLVLLSSVLATGMLLAAPPGKAMKLDPVAEGYPAWSGVTEKSYICGRKIDPSDLRHKVTVVVNLEVGEKLTSQLLLASHFVQATGLAQGGAGEGGNWETYEVPRSVIVLVSVAGSKAQESVQEYLGKKTTDQTEVQKKSLLRCQGCAVYSDVTFDGAPDMEGKRPYVYVMGAEGKEPIAQGALNEAEVKKLMTAIYKAKKDLEASETPWKPFFGTVAEPKFHPQLAKHLEKAKTAKKAPLLPITKAILKNVVSKDEAKAKEAQVLYDAIIQTKNDLLVRINLEKSHAPYCAYYDIQQLLKLWPAEAKEVAAAAASVNGGEIASLGVMYGKMKAWGDPDFTCKTSEAKKIVVDLNKMKKAMAAAKESKNITIQNCALLLDMKVDELIDRFTSLSSAK